MASRNYRHRFIHVGDIESNSFGYRPVAGSIFSLNAVSETVQARLKVVRNHGGQTGSGDADLAIGSNGEVAVAAGIRASVAETEAGDCAGIDSLDCSY